MIKQNSSRATIFINNLFRKKQFWLLLAALSLFSPSYAQVKVVVSPATKKVETGDILTVEVKAESGTQQIDGANIFLSFDPAVLRVRSVTPGNALSVPLSPVSYDDTKGLISYAYGSFFNYPSGSIHLFSVEFIANGPGNSALSFTSSNGIPTDLTFRGASVLEEKVNGSVISSAPTAPLPVTLQKFDGRSTTSGNQLNWTTATEEKSSHFVVERSEDGKNFSPIATLHAAGFSSQEINYIHVDKKAKGLTGTQYYRLKQVDLDGTFEHSFMIALQVHTKLENEPAIIAYPNPFSDVVTLVLPSGTEAETAELWLTTLEGKIIYHNQIKIAKGEERIILSDMSVTSAGMHLIRVQLRDKLFLLKLNRN